MVFITTPPRRPPKQFMARPPTPKPPATAADPRSTISPARRHDPPRWGRAGPTGTCGEGKAFPYSVLNKGYLLTQKASGEKFGVISNGTALEHFVSNGTLTSQLLLMGLPLVNMRIIGSH